MICSEFTGCTSIATIQFWYFSSTPKRNLGLICSHSLFTLAPLGNGSLPGSFLILDISYQWNHTIRGLLHQGSLSTGFLCFICVTLSFGPFMTEQQFSARTYHVDFRSPVDGHSGSLQLLAIVINAMNILGQVFVLTYIFLSLQWILFTGEPVSVI